MISVNEFISEYLKALSEGYAAVFAGAGLSRSSGYVNWKEFIRPFAKSIGLDENKEHDLISIAQYYVNKRRNRFSINQRIINEFNKRANYNENMEIITRIPIKTYWTTNYDNLIEKGLEKNNRKADVKTTQKALANNIYDRDAVVYKMHGDCQNPDEAVVTKDDYEIYGNNRQLFRTVLQGDLMSKTFLFIGFSFDDPNIEYILGQIRVLIGESIRDHYCFFEKINKNNFKDEKEYLYKKVKQELKTKDLKRYGINAVMLDSYSEITHILKTIEKQFLMKSIFISGSIENYEVPWDSFQVSNFTYHLAKKLVSENYRIVSGFGLGIGSYIINGALDEIMDTKYRHVDEYLCLRPFPQVTLDSKQKSLLWRKYREEMISQSGISIFIFGNKVDKNDYNKGMWEEFEISNRQQNIIIPIGATGGVSSEIYTKVINNIDNYSYLIDYIEELNTITSYERLIEIILEIIKKEQFI